MPDTFAAAGIQDVADMLRARLFVDAVSVRAKAYVAYGPFTKSEIEMKETVSLVSAAARIKVTARGCWNDLSQPKGIPVPSCSFPEACLSRGIKSSLASEYE